MAKFNIIGAIVFGSIALIGSLWFIAYHKSRDRDMADAVYAWASVPTIIGFVGGGFLVGSFEKDEPTKKPPEIDEEQKKKLKRKY